MLALIVPITENDDFKTMVHLILEAFRKGLLKSNEFGLSKTANHVLKFSFSHFTHFLLVLMHFLKGFLVVSPHYSQCFPFQQVSELSGLFRPRFKTGILISGVTPKLPKHSSLSLPALFVLVVPFPVNDPLTKFLHAFPPFKDLEWCLDEVFWEDAWAKSVFLFQPLKDLQTSSTESTKRLRVARALCFSKSNLSRLEGLIIEIGGRLLWGPLSLLRTTQVRGQNFFLPVVHRPSSLQGSAEQFF